MNAGARIYTIHVKGNLDPEWFEWPATLAIVNDPGGYATMHGPLRDQAELLALLLHLHDINVTLVALESHRPAKIEETSRSNQ